MSKIIEIRQIIGKMESLVSSHHTINIIKHSQGLCTLSVYGCASYEEATQVMRSLGVGKREKEVSSTLTILKGDLDEVIIRVYTEALPPTCRKETYLERVPKQEVKDTGEFYEVERTRIVCGGGNDV